jgi:uncharacterized protein (TIGR03435 family)
MTTWFDHLWQSTAFAALVWLIVLTLRRNRAAVRHALWLAASVKFLVPFSALVALGHQALAHAAAPRRQVMVVIDAVSQPFFARFDAAPPPDASVGAWRRLVDVAPEAALAVWMAGSAFVLFVWWTRWRRVAAIARGSVPVQDGRAMEALRSIERGAGIGRPIALVASPASLEPGVFGILRPVLIWPAAIAGHLTDDEMATILSHEVMHVRRRDNLAAAVHMVVEALFWFHPVVWWIGTRLLEERERACDEEVLRSGQPPLVYAESILKACRAYLESPLPCVAGVTGSDLRTRIERIMTHGASEPLAPWKKGLVSALAIGSIGAPVLVGAATPSRAGIHATLVSARLGLRRQPIFEVTSVKPNTSGAAKQMMDTEPGRRFTAINVSLGQLIRSAYGVQEFQISGGPAWLESARFDVIARGEPDAGQPMLRALLADQFKLRLHTDTKELPIYALVAVRNGRGPGLHRSARDCRAPDGGTDTSTLEPPACGVRATPGAILAAGAPMTQLAGALSRFLGREVQDRTGLTDDFDFTLRWTPDQVPPGLDQKNRAIGLPPIDPDGPSLFTALGEQLGLKLESGRGAVEILVVDRAERPTAN